MSLTRRHLLFSLAAAARADDAVVNPVVVELFTSEGCSSCPPADEVLSRLVRGELTPAVPIIALSEHVDYWNELGWKDPFSKRLFSERQEWYSKYFRGPYTPQMIVDGVAEFVGSDVTRARASVTVAAVKPKARTQLQWSGAIDVHIEPLRTGATTADVFLAVTESGLTTSVGRGENGGRTLRHDAVVRTWKHAGSWRTDREFSARYSPVLDAGWDQSRIAAVVFAQDRSSRRVLAAASLKR